MIFMKLLDKQTKSGTLILLHPLLASYYHMDKLDYIDSIKGLKNKL